MAGWEGLVTGKKKGNYNDQIKNNGSHKDGPERGNHIYSIYFTNGNYL